jgi:hypothetical protein
MLFDENKAFPYPVLRTNEDYGQYSFQGAPQLVPEQESGGSTGNYIASVNFMPLGTPTYEPSVRQLIEDGKVSRALLIKCGTTFYRELVTGRKDRLEHRIEGGQLNGEVTLQSLAVAVKDIKGHSSPNINAEFGRAVFDLEKGSVIAIGDIASFYVILPHQEGGGQSYVSPFLLVEDPNLQDHGYRVGVEDDMIHIYVSAELYRAVKKPKDAGVRRFIFTSLYMPAVMDVLFEMKENHDEHKGKPWFHAVSARLEKKGIDLKAPVEQGFAKIAQCLLDWPMKNFLGG